MDLAQGQEKLLAQWVLYVEFGALVLAFLPGPCQLPAWAMS